MTPQQQRAIILLALIGFAVVLFPKIKAISPYSPRGISEPGLTQQIIEEHPLLFFQAIDINRASAVELTGVPGIGPVLAGRIVTYRNKHGSFQVIDELENVYGIGPRSIERFRPHLRVDEK